jgi:hypothetical protein
VGAELDAHFAQQICGFFHYVFVGLGAKDNGGFAFHGESVPRFTLL